MGREGRGVMVGSHTCCRSSAKSCVAARLSVAKYMAVVVPLVSRRSMSLEYSQRASASCACLASEGKV